MRFQCFLRFRLTPGLVAAAAAAAASFSAEGYLSRNHVWDITFPLEQNAAYSYEPGWHLCRDSCTRAHRATDIYAPPGTPVYAAASGVIGWRRTSVDEAWSPVSGSGYSLYIDVNLSGQPLRHFYGHFGPDLPGKEAQAFAVNPATGQLWKRRDTVERGQLLGWVGTSGATASGLHLHFEIRSRTRGLPLDDPGEDAIPGRSYGNPNASIGSFTFPRYDPFPSFAAAEERGDYPPSGFAPGLMARVRGVSHALNTRGPGPCDDPIPGASKPNGTVGKILDGPERCGFTGYDMWLINWSDCSVGWASQRFLEISPPPEEFCPDPDPRELSLRIEGGGAVIPHPRFPRHPAGSTVELTAVAETEFDFIGWSGDVDSTANPLLLAMEEDMELTARFARTYEAWARSRFSPGELAAGEGTAPWETPFGHGLANLLVFAFGMNERQPDPSLLPKLEREEGGFSFLHARLRESAGIEYRVESSTDLLQWLPLDPLEVAWENGEEGSATAMARIRLGPEEETDVRFIRLRVVQTGT